jgi:hypothetical protein
MEDCADVLKRWITMVDRIDDEMVDLMWQREQIQRIGKMIEENPQLKASPKPFLWDVRRWYMYFAAMAVRRQTDPNRNRASLTRLLGEIKERPDCITRQLMIDQFRAVYKANTDSDFESHLIDANWSRWSAADGSLNAARVQADLDTLVSVSKELMIFASSLIAHTSLGAIGKETKLTFNDMDAAIDLLERLAIDYRSLLTGRGSVTLLPTEQFDWYEQFRFAWRPRRDASGTSGAPGNDTGD